MLVKLHVTLLSTVTHKGFQEKGTMDGCMDAWETAKWPWEGGKMSRYVTSSLCFCYVVHYVEWGLAAQSGLMFDTSLLVRQIVDLERRGEHSILFLTLPVEACVY